MTSPASASHGIQLPAVPHILVTAGPTREKIDAVRDWGNIFSGQTGLDLALAFLELGPVTLLTSNAAHARQYDGYKGERGVLRVETFKSHADLRGLLAARMTGGDRVDVVAMTAAVSDYAPAGAYRIVSRARGAGGRETWEVEAVGVPGEGKVKSTFDEVALVGRRTEKLVDMFRRDWHFGGVLIKFKLEVGLSDDDLLRVAGASRTTSGADLMVANTLAMARPTDGSEGGAFLIDEGGARRVGRKMLAQEVVGWVKRFQH
jgi:phosphopantothenoylcysteine synthetase/decarboxylase